MNLQLLSARGRSIPDTRRPRAARFRRLLCEGLEERVVLSAAPVGHALPADLMPHFAFQPAPQVHALTAPVSRGMVHAAPAAIRHVVSVPATTIRSTATPAASAPTTLVTLDLKPIDVNLLGLEVKTSEIKVNVQAQAGPGLLLGNLLTDVSGLLNLRGVNNALNTVLGNVVTLVNSASLSVPNLNLTGAIPAPAVAATVPVLNLHVAPVHLNLLGAIVTTSPIDVQIVAHSGPGSNLLLGNIVADLANLLNGQPATAKLSINAINADLQKLLGQITSQIGTSGTTTPPPALPAGTSQVVNLTVPPIDLNLLGLVLQTDQIQVNVGAQSGNGNLLGNLLHQALNTLGATPQNLSTLSNNVNGILGKVISVLNASNLTLPPSAVNSLSPLLQKLALPNLVSTATTASAPVLNLDIAAMQGSRPPIDVNLLGLVVTTSNVHAQLTAVTGPANLLGNLVYNVSHLLDPNGTVGVLSILSGLGI